LSAIASPMVCGIADIHTSKGPAIYTCLGLGSCIGLAAYEASSDVSGMIHVMLPEAFPDRPVDKPGKFADTGMPALVEQMARLGADRRRIVVAYAGGAQVFKFGAAGPGRLDVGHRNAAAVAGQAAKLGLRVVASEAGGSNGRSVTFDATTGEVRVRSVQGGERVLATLKR
jgi:chemotaxis protein CheD